MKRILIVSAVLALTACNQAKIGYVDTVKLMNDYQEKKDVEAKYQTKADAFSKKRDSITTAFRAEAQAFQSRAASLSESKAQEEYTKIQQKSQQIGQQLQMEEQGLQQQSQTEMDSLVAKVKREIKAYGEGNGFSYILSGGDGGAVLYGSDTNNVTEAVTKILNDKYKK